MRDNENQLELITPTELISTRPENDVWGLLSLSLILTLALKGHVVDHQASRQIEPRATLGKRS